MLKAQISTSNSDLSLAEMMYVDIVWQMGKYKYGSSGHSHSGNILFLVYTFLYLSADVIIAIYLTNLIH